MQNFQQNIADNNRLDHIGSVQTIHAVGSDDTVLFIFYENGLFAHFSQVEGMFIDIVLDDIDQFG